jgi:hypothetical protein
MAFVVLIVIRRRFFAVNSAFKGTVSPDIGLYFRFWKIILVLSAGTLMVF